MRELEGGAGRLGADGAVGDVFAGEPGGDAEGVAEFGPAVAGQDGNAFAEDCPFLLEGAGEGAGSAEHGAHVAGALGVGFCGGGVAEVLFVVLHEAHVDCWDAAEDVEVGFADAFPGPGGVEAAAFEFDCASGPEEWKEGDGDAGGVVDWQSMKNEISFTEPMLICELGCHVEEESPSLHSTLGRPGRARSEDDICRLVQINVLVRRDLEILGLKGWVH